MLLYGAPILFALFAWWFLTGAVLYLVGMPRLRLSWIMAGATAIAGVAVYILWATRGDTTAFSAYLAFLAALLLWGWHEISFLTGVVTGPRTSASPQRAGGRAPLWASIETLLYHEVAILLTVLALAMLLYGSPNEVGLWTFLILWVMRISAKLNVYLGVPNLTEEFLPQHLVYLKSYFCRRSMNLLFPVSVTLSTIMTVILVQQATAAGASEFQVVAATFQATLLGLAVLEHWFLVIPLPSAALWNWGLTSRQHDDGTDGLRPATLIGKVSAGDPPCPVSASIF